MKLIHLSDLHLGKRVNGFSMIEDQTYILTKILEIVEAESPDGVILAGDLYDKPVPPTEAVRLFDDFLVALAARRVPVFAISGNHDSADRLAFGSRLMDAEGVHLAQAYRGDVAPFPLEDGLGPFFVYMLPFIRPADVKNALPEAEIETYTDAVRAAVRRMAPDPAARNVLVAHQFVTGAERSDSEEVSVGGLDNVDASAFEPFDYVALGHIHGPQNIGGPRVRYCGTPLKYSFSEEAHTKSVTVAEFGKKGELSVRTVPLTPLRDLRTVRGTYDELTLRANYEGTATGDYLRAVLTDEMDVPDAAARLRVIYPNLMKVEYDNQRTRALGATPMAEAAERRSELELLAEFFEKANGRPLSEPQRELALRLMEASKEEAR